MKTEDLYYCLSAENPLHRKKISFLSICQKIEAYNEK